MSAHQEKILELLKKEIETALAKEESSRGTWHHNQAQGYTNGLMEARDIILREFAKEDK
jgi:hypothetical protein